jgi:ubiquitin C-terminal hydrolase
VEIEDRKMGLGTLERCIEHSKEPEIVMDVFCEGCDKKTEWEKRSQIEEVPPYLFIHLKRLVFDYQFSFQKIKIHSSLHFPHHL